MGIRFRCHHCEHELHVKDFLAGKRGKCPKCDGRFRIPEANAPRSLPVDSSRQLESAAAVGPSPSASQPDTASTKDHPSASISTPQLSKQPASSSADHVLREHEITLEREADDGSAADLVPSALINGADATWYVRIADGSQFGPASEDILLQWLGENRIQPDSLIWRDGWEKWQIASETFDDYFSQRQALERTPSKSGELAASLEVKAQSAALSANELTTSAKHDAVVKAGQDRVDKQPAVISDKNRLERRRRRRRNYRLTISLLSVAAVLLIVTLIIVLIVQQS